MKSSPDSTLTRQFPYIRRIIADETWLEGERRGHWVSPEDPIVRDKVCAVILRIGAQLRQQAILAATSHEEEAKVTTVSFRHTAPAGLPCAA